MTNPNRKKGKANRKHGRNALFCKAYRARGQREKNKRVRLLKHLKRAPGDFCAQTALGSLQGLTNL